MNPAWVRPMLPAPTGVRVIRQSVQSPRLAFSTDDGGWWFDGQRWFRSATAAKAGSGKQAYSVSGVNP